MTRRHYIAIAEQFAIVWSLSNEDQRCALNLLANHIADVATDDNPRFDRDRFLRACGFLDPGALA